MVTMNTYQNDRHCYVVHPLDDVREAKCDAELLGPMPMTASVKLSLLALRGYLMLMGLLVLYHVLDLAGVFHHLRSRSVKRCITDRRVVDFQIDDPFFVREQANSTQHLLNLPNLPDQVRRQRRLVRFPAIRINNPSSFFVFFVLNASLISPHPTLPQ
jgi:hypothetical protein